MDDGRLPDRDRRGRWSRGIPRVTESQGPENRLLTAAAEWVDLDAASRTYVDDGNERLDNTSAFAAGWRGSGARRHRWMVRLYYGSGIRRARLAPREIANRGPLTITTSRDAL